MTKVGGGSAGYRSYVAHLIKAGTVHTGGENFADDRLPPTRSDRGERRVDSTVWRKYTPRHNRNKTRLLHIVSVRVEFRYPFTPTWDMTGKGDADVFREGHAQRISQGCLEVVERHLPCRLTGEINLSCLDLTFAHHGAQGYT